MRAHSSLSRFTQPTAQLMRSRVARALLCIVPLLLAACGDDDGATPDGSAPPGTDAGARDLGTRPDGGFPDGAVLMLPDGSTTSDGGGVSLPRPTTLCALPTEGALVDTSAPDHTVGDGTPASCTEAALRSAIALGGSIAFDCGAAPITITVSSELRVSNAAPALVIDGGGTVTLSGGGTSRILWMNACESPVSPRCDTDERPRVTVQRLTFRDGYSMDTVPDTKETDTGGAAIFRHGGTLTVIDSDFLSNTCDTFGQDVSGGAITSQQSQRTLIVGSNFIGNRCANGGAVGSLQARIDIYNSVFLSNEATGSGGNRVPTAAAMAMGDTGGDGGNGGAIVIDGQNNPTVLCGVVLADNTGHAQGSALFRTGYNSESFEMDRCLVEGNHITGLAYPESDLDRHNPGLGTLYLQGIAVNIHETLIANNQSDRGVPGIFIANMGGASGRLDLTNVTIAGNQIRGGGIGGAIFNGYGGTGTWTNVTIADNGANFAGGIVGGGFRLVNTLIVDNRRDDTDTTGMYNPLNCFCPGGCSLENGGGNLQWPTMGSNGRVEELCAPGITLSDAALGPLADNGGPTRTLLPAAGSPAVGIGNGCPPIDQRGRPRAASGCTAGAVEVE